MKSRTALNAWMGTALLATTLTAGALEPEPRNVIVLIPDGCGSPHTTIFRWYNGGSMNLDRMNVTAVRTHGADSLITDSAPAASAMACGYKTDDKYIGVLPNSVTIPGVPATPPELWYKPIANVLGGAKLKGKAVGLIATSQIQHATPAGFSVHVQNRGLYHEIAEQQVFHDIDVLFGGGMQYLRTPADGGSRTDGQDMIAVLASRGYDIVTNRAEMLACAASKVWGLFAPVDMAYEFDRRLQRPDEPSLAEMTQKAIDILSADADGFFLLVEGSKVDWASHANDPIGVISDIMAFDEAIGTAMDFAEANGNTLVIALSDHGNGGMSLGNKSTDNTYSKLPISALIAPLTNAILTGEGIERQLGSDRSDANIVAVMAQYYGVTNLSPTEIAAIAAAPAGSMNYVVGPMISSGPGRSVIGWTTGGHVGEDLFGYYYGLDQAVPTLQNTDVAEVAAEYMGFDLAQVDNRLFVEAAAAFAAIGATTSVDASDPQNKVLVVQKGDLEARFPFATDLMTVKHIPTSQSVTLALEGISVLAYDQRAYVPRQAVMLMNHTPAWFLGLGI